jgi:hypothetical protein
LTAERSRPAVVFLGALRVALGDQLKGSFDVDCPLDGPCHRAFGGMDAVHALDYLPLAHWRLQLVPDFNAANHQDISFQFDLSSNLGDQFAVAGVDLARFQRASKGSGQSSSCCRNHVIQGRGAGGEFAWRNFVVPSDFRMNTESHRFLFRRQIGETHRTRLALNSYLGGVDHVTGVRHDNPS